MDSIFYGTLAFGIVGVLWIVWYYVKHARFLGSAIKVQAEFVDYKVTSSYDHDQKREVYTRVPQFRFLLGGREYKVYGNRCSKPLFGKTRTLYCKRDDPYMVRQRYHVFQDGGKLILLLFFLGVIAGSIWRIQLG